MKKAKRESRRARMMEQRLRGREWKKGEKSRRDKRRAGDGARACATRRKFYACDIKCMRKNEKKRWEARETCAFAGSEGAKRRVARERTKGMNRGWQVERLRRRRRRRRWNERVNLLLYFSPFVSTTCIWVSLGEDSDERVREKEAERKRDEELCDSKS